MPERRAGHVRAHQEHRAPGAPVALAHVAIALDEAPRRRHEQRPREVRGRLGEDAGRVADGDAARRARSHVDVVEPDREVAHDLELRPRPIEELVVDAVGQERQDAVAALDGLEELLARRRQLVLPDDRIARVEDRAQPVVGDDPRDEDLRPIRHRTAAPTSTKARIRASASVEIRAGVGVRDADVVLPTPPKAVPARTHTPDSWSSRSASSLPVRPVPLTSGKT